MNLLGPALHINKPDSYWSGRIQVAVPFPYINFTNTYFTIRDVIIEIIYSSGLDPIANPSPNAVMHLSMCSSLWCTWLKIDT